MRTGLAAFFLVVAASAPSLPRGVTNWDNIVKLQVARSLLRGDGLVLGGSTPDDAVYVQVGNDGRRYSSYPPLAAALQVLTIQVALLTGFEAEGVPAVCLLALVAWALVSWAKRSGVSTAGAATGAMAACFGTALWPMAACGYDVLVEVLALVLTLRAGEGERRELGPWLLAGVGLGMAFATRLGAALLGVPAAVMAVAARPPGLRSAIRRGAALALGSAPGILLVLWNNFHRFGSVFEVLRPGALGGVNDLTVPWFSWLHLEGIAGLLVSPGKGLVWYAPPMVLVAVAAPALARRNRSAALALGAYACTTLVVLGRFRYWHGDWGWGPRYVAPLFVAAAPLAWLVAERAERWTRAARIGALAGLVLAITLQAAPVLGRPVAYHFALVVAPLSQQGRLATRPMTRPPGPEDYGIQYFDPRNSMIVSLGRGLARAAAKEGFWYRALRVLVVPLAAAGFVTVQRLASGRPDPASTMRTA